MASAVPVTDQCHAHDGHEIGWITIAAMMAAVVGIGRPCARASGATARSLPPVPFAAYASANRLKAPPDPAICAAGVGRTWSSPTWSGPEGSSHNDFAAGRSGSHRAVCESDDCIAPARDAQARPAALRAASDDAALPRRILELAVRYPVHFRHRLWLRSPVMRFTPIFAAILAFRRHGECRAGVRSRCSAQACRLSAHQSNAIDFATGTTADQYRGRRGWRGDRGWRGNRGWRGDRGYRRGYYRRGYAYRPYRWNRGRVVCRYRYGVSRRCFRSLLRAHRPSTLRRADPR